MNLNLCTKTEGAVANAAENSKKKKRIEGDNQLGKEQLLKKVLPASSTEKLEG